MTLADIEKAREARIRENQARLAALKVGDIVNGLVSREVAAKKKAAEEEERRRAQIRADLAAVEPRRKSVRTSAAKTRIKLAEQAQDSPDASDSGEAGSEQSAASASNSESDVAGRDCSSKDEEVEYDPLADLGHDGSGHESSEDEDEHDPEEERESDSSDLQQPSKRSKHPGVLAGRRKGKQPASRLHAEPAVIDDEDENDADLQRALAMSLMEANAAHAGPNISARDIADSSDQQHKASLASTPDTQAGPSGSVSRSGGQAKGQGITANGTEKQSKAKGTGKRRRAAALEANPEDVKKAFSMIAPRFTRISQQLLAQVWEDVRGGKLDAASTKNMMTYAADVTGSETLDFAAFKTLVAHFS